MFVTSALVGHGASRRRRSGGIPVRLYRDRDPGVALLPGMDLGPAVADGDLGALAGSWFRRGVRLVVLPETVVLADMLDPGDLRRLALIRDLTGHAVAVDWRLRLDGDVEGWSVRLGHLYPPRLLHVGQGREDRSGPRLARWWSDFAIGRCCYRKGPGFLHVVDRRHGLRPPVIIDDPAELAAAAALEYGCPLHRADEKAMDRFLRWGLAARIGGGLLWLPYRLRRWPLSAWAG